jgi:hypothetical protein
MRYYREDHHHIVLSRPDTPRLELHFRLTNGFGRSVPSDDFMSRSTPHRMTTGSKVWVLSPEDELLYMAAHAARHAFSLSIWLYDLKLLLLRFPDLDWAALSARARSLGLLSALSMSFDVLNRRLGVVIPVGHDFAPTHKALARLAKVVLKIATRQPVPSRRESAARALFRALLCDQPVSSAWLLRRPLLRYIRRGAQRCLPALTPRNSSQ